MKKMFILVIGIVATISMYSQEVFYYYNNEKISCSSAFVIRMLRVVNFKFRFALQMLYPLLPNCKFGSRGLASNITYKSYIRFFFSNHKFYAFSVTGDTDNKNKLLYYKNLFFNSINFY